MKVCLICKTENPNAAATCSACGEGSFGDHVYRKFSEIRRALSVEPKAESDSTEATQPERSSGRKRK